MYLRSDARAFLAGTEQGFNLNSAVPLVPKGSVIVGDYHTHADYATVDPATGTAIRTSNPALDLFNSDNFSTGDYRGITVDAAGISDYRGYLGTPSGVFRAFNPHAPVGKQEYVIKP